MHSACKGGEVLWQVRVCSTLCGLCGEHIIRTFKRGTERDSIDVWFFVRFYVSVWLVMKLFCNCSLGLIVLV